MEKIKVLIVDDETTASESLSLLIKTYCPEAEVIGIANEIKQGVKLINQTNPDVVFLDIELRQGTGFDLLEHFALLTFQVIFVTAYQEYALKAIKKSALDYLLKPVDIEELRQALGRVKQTNEKKVFRQNTSEIRSIKEANKERLVLHSSQGFTVIYIKDLMYCKADGNYLHFVCFDGSDYFITRNMKEYDVLLTPHGFFRIHHSYLINLRAVKQFLKADGGMIILENGTKLPVSVRKRDVFLKRIGQIAFE